MEVISEAEAIDTSTLTDDELLASVRSIFARDDRGIASSIVHIMEIEDRRLHLRSACSSLKDFCIRKLGLNEGKASRRINGARIARCFPVVLEAISDGRVCLSHVVRLRDHFTNENVEGLLVELQACRTRRQMQELMARIAPKPDVEETIERLPEISVADTQAEVERSGGDASSPTLQRALTPLSPGRYQLTLTLSSEDVETLERICDATAHTNPSRKAQPVVSTALKRYLEELEKERAGTPDEKPRNVRKPRNPATIARATRRKVHRRDGGRCAYVDVATGERCPARAFLQLDHRLARAHGGAGEAHNVRLLCQAHNLFEAELAFGRDHVEACIARKRASGAPSIVMTTVLSPPPTLDVAASAAPPATHEITASSAPPTTPDVADHPSSEDLAAVPTKAPLGATPVAIVGTAVRATADATIAPATPSTG